MKRFQALIIPIIISVLVSVVYHQALKPDAPFTHDSQNHIARMANYYLALKQGQFPPRWAPTLNNNFGYPVFNFNYPLPNILALPLIASNIPIQLSYQLLSIISLIIAALGIYAFIRTRYAVIPAIGGSMLYVFNPYQLNLVFVRGNIGELWFLALLPWVLYFTHHLIQKNPTPFHRLGFIISLAALLLSHNIFAFFGSFILIIVGWLWFQPSINQIKKILIPSAISLLIISFFWIPALLEKSHTTLDQVALNTQAAKHAPTLGQLTFDTFTYGFSNPGPVDGMGFHLGSIPWLMFALACITVATRINKRNTTIKGLIALSSFIILLQLEPIFLHVSQLPLVNYLQFPWRLSAFIYLLLAIIIAWLITQYATYKKAWVGIIITLILITIVQAKPFATFNHPDEYWLTYTQTTSILDENMPKHFEKTPTYQLDQTLFADQPVAATSSTANITQNVWTGTQYHYQVTTQEPTQIIERTAFFPGWQVRVNGEVEPIQSNLKDYPGLITYKLKPGTHTIKSSFTQRTPARIIGNTLSLIGLMLGLLYISIPKFHKQLS